MSATNTRRNGLKYLQLGITAVLVAGLVWYVDWTSVLATLRQVKLGWAAGVVLLVLVERMILNIKWQALLATTGVDIAFFRLFRIQLAANALGTFLPSSIGVDALRMAGLWRYRDRRHGVVAATLLDRMSTVLATVVIGGLMIVLVAGALVGQAVVLQILAAGVVGLAIATYLLTSHGRNLVKALIRKAPRKLQDRLMEIASAALLIAGHRRAIVVTVCTSLGAVALRIVIGKGLLLACGLDVPLITLAYVLPVVWATAMLPISIGGIGVQDATYVVLLGYAGVSPPIAIVVSLLDHILTRIPIVFGVLFWRDVMPVGADAAPAADRTLSDP